MYSLWFLFCVRTFSTPLCSCYLSMSMYIYIHMRARFSSFGRGLCVVTCDPWQGVKTTRPFCCFSCFVKGFVRGLVGRLIQVSSAFLTGKLDNPNLLVLEV
ncbi:hypothetical protein V1522DRAFT_44527, partial [Lipomyces starkeyi]